MLIELSELTTIMPRAKERAVLFYDHLDAAMFEREIETVDRIAAFIAQIAHESCELLYVREIASGEAYEGRRDLGNTQRGDGRRFRGRGLLQITGRANYRDCSTDLFGSANVLLAEPELLEEPELACRSAAWFWDRKKLNALADAGKFELITRRINGGLNGYENRLKYYRRALRVLG